MSETKLIAVTFAIVVVCGLYAAFSSHDPSHPANQSVPSASALSFHQSSPTTPYAPPVQATPVSSPAPDPANEGMTPDQIKKRDAYLAKEDAVDAKAARSLDGRFDVGERMQFSYELAEQQGNLYGDDLDRINARFCRKHHMTYDELIHLMVEAGTARWPMPPDHN